MPTCVFQSLLRIALVLLPAMMIPAQSFAQTAPGSPALPCSTTVKHDWDTATPAWVSGALSNSYTLSGLGSYSFTVTSTDPLQAGTPQLSTAASGGLTPAELGLFLRMDNDTIPDFSTIVMTLPTAVPAMQFSLFDIDKSPTFEDQITVTGTFNGATVLPTLTNGPSNTVSGNVGTGSAAAGDTTALGTLTVTFSSPVDSITIRYGSGPGAPLNPGTQSMALHDITMCMPTTNLITTKTSSIVSDGISAANPKAIPNSSVRYCILVTNSGSGTATNVVATDNVPSNLSFISGTMRSGTSCAAANIVEDDNNIGADESDPIGMSVSGAIVTGRTASIAPNGTIALVFNATVN
ncbi:hypothetical protein ACFOWX_09870 [Sphingorhabdus arenilitoris]|uniref:DUF11 domain-containing protein n=1 Tax=Sphingorhabdus arenilitoris TaxID=1490041 RepID=A0ABV8RHQ5_9SPHN